MVDEEGEQLLENILGQAKCSSVAGGLIVKLNQLAKRPDVETDISSILDKYSTHLNTARVFLKNGVFNTNFAEAALLLQTATNIYSKKVDMLWDCVIGYQHRMTTYEEKTEENAAEFDKVEERKERYKRKRKKVDPPPEEAAAEAEPDVAPSPPPDSRKNYNQFYTNDQLDNLLSILEVDESPQSHPEYFDYWNHFNLEQYHLGTKSNRCNPVIVPVSMERPPQNQLPQLSYPGGRRNVAADVYAINEFDCPERIFSIENFYMLDLDDIDMNQLYHQAVTLKTKPSDIINPSPMEHALDVFLEKMTVDELRNNPDEFMSYYRSLIKKIAAEKRANQIKKLGLRRPSVVLDRLPESVVNKYRNDEADHEVDEINKQPHSSQNIRITVDSRTDSGFFDLQGSSEIDKNPTPVNQLLSGFDNLDESGIVDDINDTDHEMMDSSFIETDLNDIGVDPNETEAHDNTSETVNNSLEETMEGVNGTITDVIGVTDAINNTIIEEVVERCQRIRKRKVFDDYVTTQDDEPITPRKKYEKLRPSKIARLKDFEKFFYANYKPGKDEGTLVEPVYEDSDDDESSDDIVVLEVVEDGVPETEGPVVAEVVITSEVAEAPAIAEASQTQAASEVIEEIASDAAVTNVTDGTMDEEIQRLLDAELARRNKFHAALLADVEKSREQHKRYLEWEEFIEKKVGSQKETDFDIHEEGTKIIDSIPEINGTISYKSMCEGKSAGEVARSFIAMLQLANTANIEILGSNPGGLANETLQIKLLSKGRHHEQLAVYNAPSEESLHERLRNVKAMSRQRVPMVYSKPSTSGSCCKKSRLG